MIYRRYSAPRVWDEMNRLQREFDRMMGGWQEGENPISTSFPAMNAWTNDNEEVVTAELPGVAPEDIEITVVNDVLTVSGERRPSIPEDQLRYHRRERVCGKFSRSIQLAFVVDPGQVAAEYEHGILTVKLPRAEADKPRKISVKSS